jgi:hypothetical protein
MAPRRGLTTGDVRGLLCSRSSPRRLRRDCAGVEGDHAERLASSLATLADNATADTAHRHNDIRGTELERYIAATPAPFTLTCEQVQQTHAAGTARRQPPRGMRPASKDQQPPAQSVRR